MKIGIIGSEFLLVDVNKYIPEDTTTIISGGIGGVSKLALRYADELHIPKLVVKPEFKNHGRHAKKIANKLVIDLADKVVVLADSASGDVKEYIDYAESTKKLADVYYFGI